MHIDLQFFLMLLALVSFLLLAFGVNSRVNLLGLGLAAWVLALMVG